MSVREAWAVHMTAEATRQMGWQVALKRRWLPVPAFRCGWLAPLSDLPHDSISSESPLSVGRTWGRIPPPESALRFGGGWAAALLSWSAAMGFAALEILVCNPSERGQLRPDQDKDPRAANPIAALQDTPTCPFGAPARLLTAG